MELGEQGKMNIKLATLPRIFIHVVLLPRIFIRVVCRVNLIHCIRTPALALNTVVCFRRCRAELAFSLLPMRSAWKTLEALCYLAYVQHNRGSQVLIVPVCASQGKSGPTATTGITLHTADIRT